MAYSSVLLTLPPARVALSKVPPSGVAFLPLGIRSPRERSAGGNPHGGKPVDIEEKCNELELKRIEADAVKLTKEAERMDLSTPSTR